MNTDCWNEIGVFGDATCPELKTYYDCSHCPKYREGARLLLEGQPSADYLSEWTSILAREKEISSQNSFSAVLFRVGSHRMALSTRFFLEVVERRKVHRIPHRSNRELLGLANIRGILYLCVNLQKLLNLSEISESDAQNSNTGLRVYPRTVVVEKDGKAWAFHVDEIIGMQRFSPGDVLPLQDSEKTSRGIVEWEGKSFDVLHEDQFFERLQRSLIV